MDFMQGTQPVPSSEGDDNGGSDSKVPEIIDPDDEFDEDEILTPVGYVVKAGGKKRHREAKEIERIQNANARRFMQPRKGLKTLYTGYDDEMDSEDQPDLEEYFSNWHISPKDVILICRSYASYVAASQKATKK